MSACSEAPTLVMFRGGFVAPLRVLSVLWQLENRGARFELEAEGGFRVIPASILTVDDTAFLRRHRDEARRVLEYAADDSHLFSDARPKSSRHETPAGASIERLR
jgi:hypothetical protein